MVEPVSGRVLVDAIEKAETFWENGVGLLGRKFLPVGMGFLLPHCGSVHTCFMRFPIDVVFLNASGDVRKVVYALKPWRFAFCWGATQTLELAAGEAAACGLREGITVAVVPNTA